MRIAPPLYPKELQLAGTHFGMLDPSSMQTLTPDCNLNAAVVFQFRQHTSMCL